jgi:hypothetical protein
MQIDEDKAEFGSNAAMALTPWMNATNVVCCRS